MSQIECFQLSAILSVKLTDWGILRLQILEGTNFSEFSK